MVQARVGEGMQRAMVATDSEDSYLDGAKAYSVTLPADIPAEKHWSIVVYDPQTRSMLQAPRSSMPSVSSRSAFSNPDGSTTIHFGPEPPDGERTNWIETVAGKGWFAILRLYQPMQSWFDGSWRPGAVEAAR
jgi:hypothetical protein